MQTRKQIRDFGQDLSNIVPERLGDKKKSLRSYQESDY